MPPRRLAQYLPLGGCELGVERLCELDHLARADHEHLEVLETDCIVSSCLGVEPHRLQNTVDACCRADGSLRASTAVSEFGSSPTVAEAREREDGAVDRSHALSLNTLLQLFVCLPFSAFTETQTCDVQPLRSVDAPAPATPVEPPARRATGSSRSRTVTCSGEFRNVHAGQAMRPVRVWRRTDRHCICTDACGCGRRPLD